MLFRSALSGAGYPGVSAMDSTGNVIPYISGEEAKVETETRRIMGTFSGDTVVDANIQISAHCNRVPVLDGHMICLSLRLSGNPEATDIAEALERFVPSISTLNLPSSPDRFVFLRHEQDRPQPRRDVEDGNGMTMHIGRIRSCPVMGTKLVVLGHNVERGAAGGSLLNAELAVERGYLSGFSLCSVQKSSNLDERQTRDPGTFRVLQYRNLLPDAESRGLDESVFGNGKEKECEIWT